MIKEPQDPKEKKYRGSTGRVLETIVSTKFTEESVTLSSLKDALHERGFGLLMVLFTFPIAIPLPYPPGFTTLFGIPLMFFSFQMILGYDSPWLPKWLGHKKISKEKLVKIIEMASPSLRRIERFLHARFLFMSTKFAERAIGVVAFLCAISISLPIMFGNAVPALGILVMSLGLLRRDGLVILIGMCLGLIGLFIAGFVVVVGVEAAKKIFNLIMFWEIHG